MTDDKTEKDKKYQEEIDLIHKLNPGLAAEQKYRAEIDLIHQLQPELRGASSAYDPAVNLNSLGLVPPTTPKNQPRPSLPWWEVAKGMYKNTQQSMSKFLNSAYETWNHSSNALEALTSGLPPIDSVEAAVNATKEAAKAAPATAAGVMMNQLTPEARAMLAQDHPELKAPMEAGQSFGQAAHNAGQAVVNYLDESYHSRPGEPMGTALSYSLRDRPWQTLADLSIPVAGMGAGLTRMGYDAAWRAGLAERMVAKGIPGGVAKAAVETPRMLGYAMNPLNALIPAGRLVSSGTRKMVNALTPQRMLINAVGESPELLDQILAKQLEAEQYPIVPGSVPTSGEALGANPLRAPVAPAAAPNVPAPTPPNQPPSTGLVGPGTGMPASPVNPAGAAPNHAAAAAALGLEPAAVEAMLLAPPVGQEVQAMGSMKMATPSTAVVPAPSNALARMREPNAVVPAPETGVEGYVPPLHNTYTVEPNAQLPPGPGGTPTNVLAGRVPGAAPPPGAPGVTAPANPGSPAVNATFWARMVKDAEDGASTDFVNLHERNNNARSKFLETTMAQTPEVLDRAVANHLALSDNTNPTTRYGRAYPKISQGDAELHDILTTRPLSSDVLTRAQELLGESKTPFQIGTYVPAHTDAAGRFVPAQYPKYSGEALDAIKSAFDDVAFDPKYVRKSGAGITGRESRAIQRTRDEFLNWVGRPQNNPELIQAINEFRDREQVLAQMKLGQMFRKILQDPLTETNTIDQKLAAFRKALKDPLGEFSPTGNKRFLLNATGSKIASKIEDIATPQMMEMLHAIDADLGREAFDASRAAKGGEFANKIKTAASDQVNMKALKGVLGGVIPDTVNALTGLVTKPADERVYGRMRNALKTPTGTARIIMDAKAQQELFDRVGAGLRWTANTTHNLTNRIPTTYNVIEQQRDAKKKKDEGK